MGEKLNFKLQTSTGFLRSRFLLKAILLSSCTSLRSDTCNATGGSCYDASVLRRPIDGRALFLPRSRTYLACNKEPIYRPGVLSEYRSRSSNAVLICCHFDYFALQVTVQSFLNRKFSASRDDMYKFVKIFVHVNQHFLTTFHHL